MHLYVKSRCSWVSVAHGRCKGVTVLSDFKIVNFCAFCKFICLIENEDVKRTTLRELKVLRMLKQENIVELRYVQ